MKLLRTKSLNMIMVLIALAVGAEVMASALETNEMKSMTLSTLSAEDGRYDTAEMRLGILTFDRNILRTVERPFLPNTDAPDGVGGGKPFKSAVLPGDYDLVLRDSPEKGMRWHLVNHDLHVYLEKDDRDHDWQRYCAMFHPANWPFEVAACVGPGKRIYEHPSNGLGVSNSAASLKVIERYLEGESIARLRIV